MTRRLVFLMMVIFVTCSIAWTKEENDDYSRLARLSYLEGEVSFKNASDPDWSAASINLPLEPGDRIFTGSKGRAEIQFDDGSVFRLAEDTDIEILSLKEDLVQLRIMMGLTTLMTTSETDFEINTPAAAFNTKRAGIYRFDVIENGDTDAIVRKGELEAGNNEFEQKVVRNELIHISPQTSGDPEISDYERHDEWDEWNDRRNAYALENGSRGYLPENVTIGASDLNRNGRWISVEEYGNAWVPSYVDASWSPYSVGRWCYRPLYGWTWVSYEPWGWLPYHYGSWYNSPRYGWCWIPGPAFSFYFWSPGLVSFYNGPGWVSWCPLGPGDYYNISYYHYNRHQHQHYLTYLIKLHHRAPENNFHRNTPGAFRTVSLDHFRDGNFRDRDRNSRWERVDKPWSQGAFVKGRLDIKPSHMSYRPAPDRIAAWPVHRNELPSIVRHVPGVYPDNNHGRFTRITNPNPVSESRIWRNRNRTDENGRERVQSNPRDQVPSRDRDEQGSRWRRNTPITQDSNESGDRSRERTRTNTRVIQVPDRSRTGEEKAQERRERRNILETQDNNDSDNRSRERSRTNTPENQQDRNPKGDDQREQRHNTPLYREDKNSDRKSSRIDDYNRFSQQPSNVSRIERIIPEQRQAPASSAKPEIRNDSHRFESTRSAEPNRAWRSDNSSATRDEGRRSDSASRWSGANRSQDGSSSGRHRR
jgi:hypothetical protein